jgi:phosphoserine phosphatase RsbU/P
LEERIFMDSKPIKVLLIEDDPDDYQILRRMLQKARGARFELHCAPTLAEGIQELESGAFDVVLLDLALPDSKGLETFYNLHAQFSGTPIIVLSGLDDENVAITAVHAGAQDYLVKGQIDTQLLTRAIIYAIERSQAKVALQEAEKKFRSIFENAVEGIFQTTPDGRYLSANPALTRIYGYDSPAELISTLTDIGRLLYVDPNRRADFIRLMHDSDVVTDFESQVYRKDGSIIWIAENVRGVRDEEGRLLHYEGTVQDITEHKRVEEKLRNSEALYHSLVETLPQHIFRKDLNERFTFANKHFCDTVGKPLEEILGKTDFDFFPPKLAAKYQQDDQQIITTGKSMETVEQHQRASGERLYVQVVKTPLFDAEGKIMGLQGIFWDITSKKEAEERERIAAREIARSKEELRKKNEMMEDDLKMAREIQLAILPQQYPTFPPDVPPEQSSLRFCHRYRPTGQVGGDFFNVLQLSDNKAGVFICDVMGHGVRSALITAMVSALVEELRNIAPDPGKLLSRLNHDLRMTLQQSGTPLFTTAFYVVADLENREFLYSNAGHPKPFVINRPHRTVEVLRNLDGKPKPALGLFADLSYPTYKHPMNLGDTVLLYTDGLYEVESPDHTQYSQEMLMADMKQYAHLSCSDLIESILARMQSFAATQEFEDDVCMLGVEVLK